VAASDAEVRSGQARAASQLTPREGNQEGGISGTKEGTIALGPRELMAKPILPVARRAPANLSTGVHSSLNVVCGGVSNPFCSGTQ
jgi:hypothetical protein